MVDRPALAELSVVPGPGAVPIGIEQEGAVVVLAVLRPHPGLAVASVPVLRPRPPERVDERSGGGGEPDVQAGRQRPLRVASEEAEVVPFDVLRALMGRGVAEL